MKISHFLIEIQVESCNKFTPFLWTFHFVTSTTANKQTKEKKNNFAFFILLTRKFHMVVSRCCFFQFYCFFDGQFSGDVKTLFFCSEIINNLRTPMGKHFTWKRRKHCTHEMFFYFRKSFFFTRSEYCHKKIGSKNLIDLFWI